MKKIPLYHPRIFSHPKLVKIYIQQNARFIHNIGLHHIKLLKKAGFESGNVLDVGCGYGEIAVEMARAFPNIRITGVDLAEPLLKIADEKARSAGVEDRINLILGDIHNLEFEDNTFDLVINTLVLHIVENPLKMLNEIERVAKKDGMIILSDLKRSWMGIFKKKLKTALTMKEGMEIMKSTHIRRGTYHSKIIRWDFTAGVTMK